MKLDLHKMLSCIKLYFKICGSTLAPSNNIEDGANKPHKVIFTKDTLIFPPLLCGLPLPQTYFKKMDQETCLNGLKRGFWTYCTRMTLHFATTLFWFPFIKL